MPRAPLVAPALGIVAAIAAEQHGAALLVALAALAGIAVAFASAPAQRRFLASVALALGAGLTLSHCAGHPPVVDRERATSRYAALVTGDVRVEPDGYSSTALLLEGIGAVRTTLRDSVSPGDSIVVRGRLEPFDEPRNPGEPSLRDIERDDGFVARLASARVIEHAQSLVFAPQTWAARLRAAASRRIRDNIPEPSATILAGALWGERGALPDDLHDAFQATGTVHVLVTAGLHLGVVAALIVFALGRSGMHRIPACVCAIALVAGYAWFSGAHLPSQRAAAMIGCALLARACGTRASSWNCLALAAIVVATIWPASVTSASFALSFSCVTAILLFAEPIARSLEAFRLHERIREALALTCATQLGTWPLTLAIFSTLAPYAVVANAIVVPLIGVIIIGGLATLAFPLIAPLETLLLLIVEHTVRAIAALPGSHATLAPPSPAWIAAYDALALGAALALRRGAIRLAAAFLVAGCAAIVVPPLLRPPHGLEIISLDVGQGDAAVIRTPHDRIVLIDTGGELERGKGATSSAERAGARIVLGYLRRAGIRRVDLMIITHPHGDHVGGCSPIIEAMPVAMLLDSGQTYGGRAYHDCVASARAHGTPIVLARRGMRWTSGDGLTLDVLAPSLPFLADTGDDVNENSIVAMLHYSDFRELFMGDAGEVSEARLLTRGAELRADALKVGHHGSRYASTPAFIAAVRPRIAIISVGRHNTFGHPASSTLQTLEANSALTFRTDRCGAVILNPPAGLKTELSCAHH